MSESSKSFAGFWVRLGSNCIDAILLSFLSGICGVAVLHALHPVLSTAAYLKFFFVGIVPISMVITIAYFGWLNAKGRQTPGKMFFRLMVVDASFTPIPVGRSFARTSVDFFTLGLGHFWILINRKKQALHDVASKTYVVRVAQPRSGEALWIAAALVFGYFLASLPGGFLRRDFVQAFRIPTGASKPTLLVGDYMIVDKQWAKSKTPQRGDIIIFRYPRDEQLAYHKRCIGLPGDTITIRAGEVWVNGQKESLQPLKREFDAEEGREVVESEARWPEGSPYCIRHYAEHRLNDPDYGPVIVPDGQYFVLGDNRDNSSDSRYWGFVPSENILGKAGLIYFSWDRINNAIRWSRIGTEMQ